jgi:hypothetical protein
MPFVTDKRLLVVLPCTYVAEKPYSECIIPLTAFSGLFSERYKRKIVGLCMSHVRLGIRCEYLLSAIVTSGG